MRFAFGLCCRIADMIDLVEYADARNFLRIDLAEHRVGGFELPFEAGITGVDDMQQQ